MVTVDGTMLGWPEGRDEDLLAVYLGEGGGLKKQRGERSKWGYLSNERAQALGGPWIDGRSDKRVACRITGGGRPCSDGLAQQGRSLVPVCGLPGHGAIKGAHIAGFRLLQLGVDIAEGEGG